MLELSKATQLSWRKFLATDAGTEGLLFLRERTPSVGKGETHAIIFDAGVVEGYKRAIDTIPELIALQSIKEIKADNDE